MVLVILITRFITVQVVWAEQVCAIKSSVFLVDNNPAALTGLYKSFYVLQLAQPAEKTFTYSGQPINADNNNNKDFWIKRFCWAVKVNNFWASGVGFGQFSNVNYKLTGNRFLEGSADSYSISYEGDGGLNEYYWTNAVSLGKHFSVGVKSSFVSGSINQSETVTEAINYHSIHKQQDYYGNFGCRPELYETALTKNGTFLLADDFLRKQN